MVLECRSEVFNAPLILYLVNNDLLRAVDIDQDFLIQLIVLSRLVPQRVNHQNILARLEHNILSQ